MTGIRIFKASSGDAERWDRYVLSHGGFFHRFGWGQVIADTYGHEPIYLCAENQGEIVGILPLIDRRSLFFGRALISVGFTVGGGLIANTPEIEAALLEAAHAHAQERGADYIELRSYDQAHLGWHEKHGIYDNFACPILEDREARLKAIPRKKRADLRKAIKKAEAGEIRAVVLEGSASFWQHYAQAQRNHGTPVFPKSWLRHQCAAFGSDMDITMVYAGDTPLAGVVNYYHRDTVYLYSAFISDQARRFHAGDYLYWWMMEHAQARGMSVFDLGRSKRGTGSHAYKTFWGIEPQPMVYLYRLMKSDEMPNVNPQNPKFALMTKMWRHLPLSVANRLGPVLAGHLA